LPYQYNPHDIHNFEKINNTVFVGDFNSNRRKHIISNIPDITVITDKYNKDLSDSLFRHKVLVNIHHSDDFKIHEQIRTTRCVFNRMIVVSESSLDDNMLPLYAHMIIVEYDKIIDTVRDVIDNYEIYYDKLFNNDAFDIVKETLKLTLLNSSKDIYRDVN
jgi:hypothetical protein